MSPKANAATLSLIPKPRFIERHEEEFRLPAGVRIVVGSAHAREDRFAAEILASEIADATGRRPSIATAKTAPAAAVIYLTRLGDDARLRAALKKFKLNGDDLDAEGYLIYSDTKHIFVAATTGQGLFYGVQTLRQLIRPETKGRGRRAKQMICPAVAIKDWPAMRWRGIQDDLSRGPIRTLEYMKGQVRTIAAYKLNVLALYMEHVFAYESQPLLAVPREAALKPEEVRELVAYARNYYVTILPEQQTFGHLHHLLKYEIYSDLAEMPHGHVLTPVNPGSYELVRKMYGELMPLFPGPFVHIGGDETAELGEGRTKDRVREIGPGPVYLQHLKHVSEILGPYHKKLLFWGDIAVRYPDMLNILPKDMIAVPWDYSAKPQFDDAIAPFRRAGFDVMVAPGANNWSRIFPDLETGFTNIRNFTRDGQKAAAIGMLNTVWNDDGEALFALTWPAVIFGAACSWQEGESSREDFQAAYDWAFYRNDDGVFTEAIHRLNHAQTLLARQGVFGAMDSGFWLDPFTPAGTRYAEKTLPVAHELRMDSETAAQLLMEHRPKARANADTLDALLFAAMRLDALGMKIQYTAECSRFYQLAYQNQQNPALAGRYLSEISGFGGRLEDLRESATRLRGAYEKLWQNENRPYWADNVLVRYDVMAARYQSKIEALRAAILTFRDGGKLPSPESLGFYAPSEGH